MTCCVAQRKPFSSPAQSPLTYPSQVALQRIFRTSATILHTSCIYLSSTHIHPHAPQLLSRVQRAQQPQRTLLTRLPARSLTRSLTYYSFSLVVATIVRCRRIPVHVSRELPLLYLGTVKLLDYDVYSTFHSRLERTPYVHLSWVSQKQSRPSGVPT